MKEYLSLLNGKRSRNKHNTGGVLWKQWDILASAASRLNDIQFLERTFVELWEVAFHKFAMGVSGVVIISESHLTIHSFPEHGYASIRAATELILQKHPTILRQH
jgi:hypothetical protein